MRWDDVKIDQQVHGYKRGHQLLSSSIKLSREEQDVIDRLSDISGQLRPGEIFEPYVTTYPLPGSDYYIVARTWQDLSAPRAGCVLTRSLIVQSSIWGMLPDVASLIPLLVPVDPSASVSKVSLERFGSDWPVSSDPRMVELVEALFLEARKPIVMFDVPDAHGVAMRLLNALWPSVRRNFALCTFSLAPRKLKHRDFDLLFAPKTARSRFVEWQGRRVESGSMLSSRHRWSSEIAKSIFVDPRPSLGSVDPLGALANDIQGDEQALRVTLLWRELFEKAANTPSALLGMADIVNSQPKIDPKAIVQFKQVVRQGIAHAVQHLRPPEAWSFLLTLAKKLAGSRQLGSALKPIRAKTPSLVERDPDAAIEFTFRLAEEQGELPYAVTAGLGAGLARVLPNGRRQGDLHQIDERVGLYLLANSQPFRSTIAAAVRSGSAPVALLGSFLHSGDHHWKRKAARRSLWEMDDARFAPLLREVLSNLGVGELVAAIRLLEKRTGFGISEFDDAVIAAVKDDRTLTSLRNTIFAEFDCLEANRLLAATLRLESSDVAWLYGLPHTSDRPTRLLALAMRDLSDGALIAVQRDPESRDRMIELLGRHLDIAAQQLARVLLLGQPDTSVFLEIGYSVIPFVDEPSREQLSKRMLERGFAEGEKGDTRFRALVSDNISRIGPRSIIWWATADEADNDRVEHNITLLDHLPPNSRQTLLSAIDDLSSRLAARPPGLSAQGYASWASMLWDSRSGVSDAYDRASVVALSFAIEKTDLAVSEVVAASFPSVYARLVSASDQSNRDGFLPSLLSLPRMLAQDWDRAKPARHGLIGAFMESSWPPSHLLLTAARAGIVDKVCLRLVRMKRGESYLSLAINDIGRLSKSDQSLVRKGLGDLRQLSSSQEWD